jgi:hypothetical protein
MRVDTTISEILLKISIVRAGASKGVYGGFNTGNGRRTLF